MASHKITEEVAAVSYDYKWPLLMLAFLGLAALFLGLYLKVLDSKKHLHLEDPNISAEEIPADEAEMADAEA